MQERRTNEGRNRVQHIEFLTHCMDLTPPEYHAIFFLSPPKKAAFLLQIGWVDGKQG